MKWKKRYSPPRGGMITVGETDYPYMDILKMSELADAHNADCDTYEARIAELDADLARVKAESLRVVVDGEACRICDADEGVILVGGNVYQITDHSEWIGMAEGVKYLHQEMPEYDEDTIVQPVRLERWENE